MEKHATGRTLRGLPCRTILGGADLAGNFAADHFFLLTFMLPALRAGPLGVGIGGKGVTVGMVSFGRFKGPSVGLALDREVN
jgi:hypothetical protein